MDTSHWIEPDANVIPIPRLCGGCAGNPHGHQCEGVFVLAGEDQDCQCPYCTLAGAQLRLEIHQKNGTCEGDGCELCGLLDLKIRQAAGED
jgi:hypothetical protein